MCPSSPPPPCPVAPSLGRPGVWTGALQEVDKLLYFWPPDCNTDEKMKAIGLSEALVKYSSTFAKDKPCEVVHTQASRQVRETLHDGMSRNQHGGCGVLACTVGCRRPAYEREYAFL